MNFLIISVVFSIFCAFPDTAPSHLSQLMACRYFPSSLLRQNSVDTLDSFLSLIPHINRLRNHIFSTLNKNSEQVSPYPIAIALWIITKRPTQSPSSYPFPSSNHSQHRGHMIALKRKCCMSTICFIYFGGNTFSHKAKAQVFTRPCTVLHNLVPHPILLSSP